MALFSSLPLNKLSVLSGRFIYRFLKMICPLKSATNKQELPLPIKIRMLMVCACFVKIPDNLFAKII